MATNTVQTTKLFQTFLSKSPSPVEITVVEDACNVAEDLLSQIPHTFPTYTLHDATHSKNVCDIIYDLLGESGRQKLTIHETALLLLSAYYHDTGMVYSTDEKSDLLKEPEFQIFQDNHKEVYIKISENEGEISDDIAEWYYRSIHHNRMIHVPQNIVIGKVPIGRALHAICKSHGENIALFKESHLIQTIPQHTADIFFCAILLRLADILDFDQSRAPDSLYEYLNLKDTDNIRFERSKSEFLKHKAALGFEFPEQRPSGWTLPFYSVCYDIEIEHDIRTFLDIIDKELSACSATLSNHNGRWERFSLPLSIYRHGIQSIGYHYGQYLFTLEEDKAINLFTGENLYTDKVVFVRELMQNAIDTVRHRVAEARWNNDTTYKPYIKVTTWHDNSTHHQYIRIDDNGMGMNEDKIVKFYLNVGNSYYDSVDFEVDRIRYQEKNINFKPISSFGIGILSCFIAGDKVDISTHHVSDSERVRISIEKNKRYFKLQTRNLQNQSQVSDYMPSPLSESQPLGFRREPGTTITVRIKTYKEFANLNFEEVLSKYVVYPPVPVFINGVAIPTEQDLVNDAVNAKIVEKRIPKNIIKKVEAEWGIKIDPASTFKIGLLNIGDYVTDTNKGSVSGAVLVLDSNIRFEDNFKEEFNEYIKESDCRLCVQINNDDELELVNKRRTDCKNKEKLEEQILEKFVLLAREFDSSIDLDRLKEMLLPFSLTSLLKQFPKIDSVIHLEHLIHIAYEPFEHEQKMRVYNLKRVDWYDKHMAKRSNSFAAYNGVHFHENFFYGKMKYLHNGTAGVGLLALFHDDFKPELNLSREAVRSLPLEMESEISLLEKKVMMSFFYKRPSKFRTIMSSEIMEICRRETIIPTKAILELNNVYGNDGWYEYFTGIGLLDKNINHFDFGYSKSIAQTIFHALLQKNRQLVYYPKKGCDSYISVTEGSILSDPIIESYYPPLFFLESKSKKLWLGSSGFGFLLPHNALNLSLPDAKWLIAQTPFIHGNYPAILSALIDAVYNKEEEDFNAIWKIIKTLPLG